MEFVKNCIYKVKTKSIHMKYLIILSFMIITNCTGIAQSIPEDHTPLSMLPFDYDVFCKEKMVNSLYEELRNTETFRERLLSDTTELGKVIASQFNSLKTTYMVLARNENFTLYFFQLFKDVEREEFRSSFFSKSVCYNRFMSNQ